MSNDVLTPRRLNFFFILLHPVKTLALIRECIAARERIASQQNEIKKLRNDIAGEKEMNNRLVAERSDLQRRLDETFVTVEQLTAQILGQRKELDRLSDTDQRLGNFLDQLSKVEDMKRRYEQRIKNLQARIENLIAENNLRMPGELDEPPTIDLSDTHRTKEDDDDSDWLRHI